jgi:hypothetical protein
VAFGLFLGLGDQLGGSDVECDGECCDGGEGWSALGALDPADVVAVDAGVEAEALLGDVSFVAECADGLAESGEEWVGCGHARRRCSPNVLGSTAQPCSSDWAGWQWDGR